MPHGLRSLAPHLIAWVIAICIGTTFAPPSAAADRVAVWDGSSNSWSSAAHWSTNPLYPNNGNGGFTFDATIGSGTVTQDVPATIQQLELSGGNLDGAANLYLAQGGTWSRGAMGGTGATEVAPAATLNITGSNPPPLARTINDRGTIVQTGTYGLQAAGGGSGAVVNILFGGTFDVQGNSSFATWDGASGAINNAGTFKKSVKTGTAGTDNYWTFNNSGLVKVETGTLSLAGGGTSTGTFQVDAGAGLVFGEATYNLGGSTFSNAGLITLTNAAILLFDTPVALGGTVDLGNATLGGAGAVTVQGTMNWTWGAMRGSGATDVAPGATLKVVGNNYTRLARTINIGGTIVQTGPRGPYAASGESAAVLNILAGGTFDARSDAFLSTWDGASGAVNNAGTFKKSAGTGTMTVDSHWAFNNSGLVKVESGTLALEGGGTSSGAFQVDAGAALIFRGGLHDLAAGSSLTGEGRVVVSTGQVNLAGTTGPDLTMEVSNLGTLNFGASEHLKALNIPSGNAVLTPGDPKVLVTRSLTVNTSNGRLDLTDNDLIVDYAGGTPYTPSPELGNIKAWITAGYAGRSWTGKGIISSAAVADPISLGVGYAQNDMLFAPYNAFSGEPVDSSTILVKFTYNGDLNLDGCVDDNDVTFFNLFYDGGITASHYWNEGDIFGYYGRIDDNDVTILGLTYGSGIGDPLSGAVPEPATLGLIALGAVAIAGRRRTR
ncbi:MAG: PEP-CTERM sorting domain-containing protein [Planctomycetota bacterium]|nr:PEP-CTERM sorting domain-containing protein [Planctomycetota bacterium]